MMMMMMMMIVNELKSRWQGRNLRVSRKSDLRNAARDDHLLRLTASPHDGQFRILVHVGCSPQWMPCPPRSSRNGLVGNDDCELFFLRYYLHVVIHFFFNLYIT
jgi:hypothetical protein